MVISKHLTGSTPVTINLANVAHRGTTQVWQLTATNAINRLADVDFGGNSVSVTLPAQSITLFVVPASSSLPPTAPTNLRVVR
jgi:O-glycosyl hydrolase